MNLIEEELVKTRMLQIHSKGYTSGYTDMKDNIIKALEEAKEVNNSMFSLDEMITFIKSVKTKKEYEH